MGERQLCKLEVVGSIPSTSTIFFLSLLNTNINHTYMITTLALRDFASLANDLDSRGLHKEADFIDSIIFKYSQTTGYERTLNEAVKPQVEQAKEVVRTAEQVMAMGNKAMEFVTSVLKGVRSLGKLANGTRIPGLAFVGQLLVGISSSIINIKTLTDKLKPMWLAVVELIKKVKTGKLGKVCLSAADLGNNKDSVVFLLSLLATPIIGGMVDTALGIVNKLKELGVPVKELKFCVGKDIQAQAETVRDHTTQLGKKYEKEIYEFMAVNHNVKTFDPSNMGATAIA